MTDHPALSFHSDSLRDSGERRRLEECAAEPIRTIGRIQSHGMLLGVEEGTGTVVVASDNAAGWLGRPIADVGDGVLDRAVAHGVAVDPVRVVIEGRSYDVITHRATAPLLVELEPVVPDLEYVRTGVVGAIQRLASVTDPDELRVRGADEIKRLIGFDRVMVYRFHDDGHGQVVADARESDMEPYLGLHFPASDIPVQARALYVEKRSRLIADTEDPGREVRTLLPSAEPVDLGPTELRAVSAHHLQFMRNMGQASTVSFSLVAEERLVGMITCAHRTPRRVPVLLRRALEVLASQLTMQLTAAEEITRLRRELGARARRATLTAPLHGPVDVASVLLRGASTVLDVVPADGVVLRLSGALHTLGSVPPLERTADLLAAAGDGGFVSEALPRERPDLAAELDGIAGVIVVSLEGDDRLVFLRKEVARTVEWLGDQTSANRDHDLSPRRSFSAWRESVTGQCLPWGAHAQDAFALGADIRGALAGRAQAELAELAMRDALTGLRNRRFLAERLDQLLESERGHVSVVFIDLDGFKAVNDTHGHDAGDAVLAAVGRRLSGLARGSDVVARLGGDEFVMVCIDVGDPGVVAERALAAVSEPIAVGGISIAVTASAGVVAVSEARTASQLLAAADAAMYRAKRQGGARASG